MCSWKIDEIDDANSRSYDIGERDMADVVCVVRGYRDVNVELIIGYM